MNPAKLIAIIAILLQLLFTKIVVAENSTFPTESILLHCDRDIYISGEYLFFKLYVIDNNTQKLSSISKLAYLVLRDRNSKPIANLCLTLKSGTVYGSIYLQDTLTSGSYQLVGFTNLMKNQGENSYCYNEIFIANLFDTEVTNLSAGRIHTSDSLLTNSDKLLLNDDFKLSTEKIVFARNEKIDLIISEKEHITNAFSALSISIREKTEGIKNELLPNKMLNNKTLLNYGNVSNRPTYLPETKGQIIQGKVVSRKNGIASSRCRVILSAIDTIANLLYCDSDSAGIFRFQLTDYFIGKDIIISALNDSAGNGLDFIVENKFDLHNKYNPKDLYINEALLNYIRKSQNIVYVQKNYGLQPELIKKDIHQSGTKSPVIYYKPDSRIYTSDFIDLPDFIEISRELLPTVRMRKQDENYTLELTDLKAQGYFLQKPTVFLNGVIIKNLNMIANLSSNQFERIEVLNRKVAYGSLLFEGGILALFTKEMKAGNYIYGPNSSTLIIDAYTPESSALMLKNTGSSLKSNPDFRQLVYWNPDINLTQLPKKIEFYASENTGNFIIEVFGIASDGAIISLKKEIEIK